MWVPRKIFPRVHSGDPPVPQPERHSARQQRHWGEATLRKQETVPHPHPGSRFLPGVEAGAQDRVPQAPQKAQGGPPAACPGVSHDTACASVSFSVIRGVWLEVMPSLPSSQQTDHGLCGQTSGRKSHPGLSPSPAPLEDPTALSHVTPTGRPPS